MSRPPTRIATRPDLPPWRIEWHAELDSTMHRARELALAGAPDGTVVGADFQRRGRGTHGRIWVAPPGTCLMFTFILRRSFDAAQLAELPGSVIALAGGVVRREYGVAAEVKPPNDLLVDGRKLAGVLCMSQVSGERSPWAICGLGINTNLTRGEISIENSTSLKIERGEEICHDALLEHLLRAFDRLRAG